MKPVDVEVCGKQCEHGSECLVLKSTPHKQHETQHGCIFYDDLRGEAREYHRACQAVIGVDDGDSD